MKCSTCSDQRRKPKKNLFYLYVFSTQNESSSLQVENGCAGNYFSHNMVPSVLSSCLQTATKYSNHVSLSDIKRPFAQKNPHVAPLWGLD